MRSMAQEDTVAARSDEYEAADEQDYCSARLRELENKQRLHFMSYTT